MFETLLGLLRENSKPCQCINSKHIDSRTQWKITEEKRIWNFPSPHPIKSWIFAMEVWRFTNKLLNSYPIQVLFKLSLIAPFPMSPVAQYKSISTKIQGSSIQLAHWSIIFPTSFLMHLYHTNTWYLSAFFYQISSP